MSENQPKYYIGDLPCPLSGSGKCCQEGKHHANILTAVTKESETMAVDSQTGPTTLGLHFETSGPTRLHVRGHIREWETDLVCIQAKAAEEIISRRLKPTNDQFDYIRNVTSKKLTIHTHPSPECPLAKILCEHKVQTR